MTGAPPQALEAEESVLGAMLISRNAISLVSDEITPQDFYRESHSTIYKAALALDGRGEAVDNITVINELERTGKLTDIGGRERIVELAALVPASASAGHWARIVRQQAILRNLIRAGGEISKLGWEGIGEVDHLLLRAETALSAVINTGNREEWNRIDTGLSELLEEIGEAQRSGKPRIGLETGFSELDTLTTGFHPGQLILIAARPSMGKSLLAQNIAENVADKGLHTAIFSLEMSNRELQLRSLSRATGVNSQNIRTGQVTEDQLSQLQLAASLLTTRDLYTEDQPNITVTELRARTRRLQRQTGLNLLVVDYLQLMLASKSEDSRQQEIAAISRSLKVLARELQIPVIAISQLNRALESRQEKRPTLSDLRDSGALEQDADVVMFLYRDAFYNPNTKPEDANIAELIVAKNRMGPVNTIKLAYIAGKSTFKNLPKGV